MVTGLERFKKAFADFADHYVMIGGTAATLVSADVGAGFRGTDDLDVVLIVDALTPAFGERLWEFVQAAGYESIHRNDGDHPRLYRFAKPTERGYPKMVELFCRAPAGFELDAGARRTPLVFGDGVARMSALAMDDEYYRFLISGRREVDRVSCAGADRLIPLKAHAWLNLTAQKARGESVNEYDIAKHLGDVVKLTGLLTEGETTPVSARIADDLEAFIARALLPLRTESNESDVDLAVARIRSSFLPRDGAAQ